MTDAQHAWPDAPDLDGRVEAVLSGLTLEEKISLVSGQYVQENAHTTPSGPGGLPLFHMADGPAGVRRAPDTAGEGRATALPAPIALAASWNPELAARYGDVLGAEAAAAGHNVLLGPAVDIARTPLGGRTFESFGEEPLLHVRLVVPEVQAIQRRGVQASLKHFILNNQENGRGAIDVRVGERALRELYLPPFEAALKLGHAASVMASYNRVDGTHVCEHPRLLGEVLRGELGFRGWVVSDFGANHSTAPSANAGLDWELSFAPRWQGQLMDAVQAGEVAEATLDEMVRRILRPTLGLGALTPQVNLGAIPVEAHAAVAQEVAQQGAVLLKNEGLLLPLQPAGLRRIAVIGVNADSASAAGGGSALVRPWREVSVLQGLRERAGADVEVVYLSGTDPVGPGALLPGLPPVPSSVMRPTDAADAGGFHAEYWSNPDFRGEPLVTRLEPLVELNRGFFDLPGFSDAAKRPALPDGLGVRLSARWTGILTAPASGPYTFSLTCVGRGRLELDDAPLIEVDRAQPTPVTRGGEWDGTGAPEFRAEAVLSGGQRYRVRVEYAADAPEQFFLYGAQLRLGWEPPAGTVSPAIQAAATLAGACDLAVVVARTFESEALDRPHLRLPNDQAALIRAVAAANPRTVVVLMSGGPVEGEGWEAAVPAILETWYAGQEQGRAVAALLFGDVNPSGKLPLSFPQDAAHTPLGTPQQFPGQDGEVHYDEGTNVGYRGYEALGLTPRYPFGFGLSYTSFSYANLALTPWDSDGHSPVTVRFDLTNTGLRAGAEVAQVYLSLPGEPDPPPRKLVGWARVTLQPGERCPVQVVLDPLSLERPFSRWSPEAKRWTIPTGTVRVQVGSSSRGIHLEASLTLTAQLEESPQPDTRSMPREGPS